MSPSIVLGIGMSSKATAQEVRALVESALRARSLDLHDVTVVATRQRFEADERLNLGPPVVGIEDARLGAATAPCSRTVGLRARVAETAALLTASSHCPAHLLGPVERSAYATAAVAISHAEFTRRRR